MKLQVHHTTIYRYCEPLRYSVQVLRLSPRSTHRQKIKHWELDVPAPTFSSEDALGNRVHCLCLPEARTEIAIQAMGELEIENICTDADPGPMPLAFFLRQGELTVPDLEMIDFAESFRQRIAENAFAGFELLSRSLLDRVPYVRGLTHSATRAQDAFAIGGGVCQDHSHLLLGIARYLDFPARYVSGYLYTTDEAHLASHAWVEIWIDHQWRSFDVSNQCCAGERHIQLALGLDYGDSCPIRGSRIGGGDERLFVFAQISNQ